MDEFIISAFESLGEIGNILMMLVELLLAALFSGFIGFEREKRGHAAGLRTHILVAVGACLIMQVSIDAPGLFVEGSRDPARIAAQVVSGIGFLGAGTIIKSGTDIKGLTTAATIWLCGGIGLACGAGYFTGALIASIVSILILTVLVKLEISVNKKFPRIVLTVNDKNDSLVLKSIMELASTFDVEIIDIRSNIFKDKNGNTLCRLNLQISKKSYLHVEVFGEELKKRLTPVDFKIYNR